MVRNIQFERKFLKHKNYTRNYHVYTGMHTIANRSEVEIPESIVKLLYRICLESK